MGSIQGGQKTPQPATYGHNTPQGIAAATPPSAPKPRGPLPRPTPPPWAKRGVTAVAPPQFKDTLSCQEAGPAGFSYGPTYAVLDLRPTPGSWDWWLDLAGDLARRVALSLQRRFPVKDFLNRQLDRWLDSVAERLAGRNRADLAHLVQATPAIRPTAALSPHATPDRQPLQAEAHSSGASSYHPPSSDELAQQSLDIIYPARVTRMFEPGDEPDLEPLPPPTVLGIPARETLAAPRPVSPQPQGVPPLPVTVSSLPPSPPKPVAGLVQPTQPAPSVASSVTPGPQKGCAPVLPAASRPPQRKTPQPAAGIAPLQGQQAPPPAPASPQAPTAAPAGAGASVADAEQPVPIFRPFAEEFDWDGFQHLARNTQFLNNSLNRLANSYFDATENSC